MLEFYWAYADVNQMIHLCEELLRSVVYTVTGHTHVRYGDHMIDFSQPFQRMTMKEAIVRYWPSILNRIGVDDDHMDVFDESWLDNETKTVALEQFVQELQPDQILIERKIDEQGNVSEPKALFVTEDFVPDRNKIYRSPAIM